MLQFPLVGNGRWLMERLRPMLSQYFIESDINGAPVNRVFRSVIYQRAKRGIDTVPYGTGAAPLEYSNSIGMLLTDALAFVVDTLSGYDLKKEIKIIASGEIFTGFHIVKRLSLGADLCHSARGMVLAMGCIQSLQCNANTCPAGITTQSPALVKGPVVADKISRVANFHAETVKSVAEILAAAGLSSPEALDRSYIYRRASQSAIRRYDEIYPPLRTGCLLDGEAPMPFGNDFRDQRLMV